MCASFLPTYISPGDTMTAPGGLRASHPGWVELSARGSGIKLLGEDMLLVPRPTFEALYSSIQEQVWRITSLAD